MKPKKPRALPEINNEYATLCVKLGDAHARKLIAEREIVALGIHLVALNDEATVAKKQEEPK